MFEAFVTLCAFETADACREVLLPGHAAAELAACEAGLDDIALPLTDLGIVESGPRCAPRPAPELVFEEVAEGIYVHLGAIAEADGVNLGDTSNIGFVVGETEVAVIDAGGTRALGEQVYLSIRSVCDLPIGHVILTHMHPDHVFGAEPLREAGAMVLAHQRLPRALADRSQAYLERYEALIGPEGFLGTAVPRIDAVVEMSTTLDLGGRDLLLEPRETAHTNNDLTVLDSETGVLFAGDLVFSEHLPTLDGSLRGWIALLDQMRGEPAEAVVPGHGGPLLGWPEGAEPVARYLQLLVEDTRAAIDAGERISEAAGQIGQAQAQDWALFELFNPRNATMAYTELEWE